MPWWGLGAIFLALACSAGSYLVLRLSHNAPAYRWPHWIAPNICLSILSSLSSIAITYAIGEGIAIAWWRCAMRGASVRELHSTWAFGASTKAIFTNLKFFNAVALASLMAKFSLIDGVLFQRATSTYMWIDWDNTLPVPIEAFTQESFPVTAVMGFQNDTTSTSFTAVSPSMMQPVAVRGLSVSMHYPAPVFQPIAKKPTLPTTPHRAPRTHQPPLSRCSPSISICSILMTRRITRDWNYL